MAGSQFSLMRFCKAAIICLDANGIITFLNPEAAQLLNGNASDLEGQAFFRRYMPTFKGLSHHGEQDIEITVGSGEDERIVNCRINDCPEDISAGVAYMVALEDRTRWHRVNAERDRLMEMATISEVLPAILHEFKNPLASIQAMVELMTEDSQDEELQIQLHSILMEIRRMKLSFEGLGSTTRDMVSTRDQAVDYGIREACTIFERQLKARGIAFSTDIETIPLIPLDCGGIRGVLFNLLNNAKQACDKGDSIEVRAGLKDDGKVFFFSVSDTGKGMSPEVLQQCTDLFYTTKSMGSGIGLALCRTAIEKINGRIHIESTLGEGTQITVTLPLKSNP